MEAERDVAEADASYQDQAGIRVAVVRLGGIGRLMFDGVSEMFSHFTTVQIADLLEVGGAAGWKNTVTASGCGGQLVIKYVPSASQSPWKKLSLSKKVFAVVALAHPRRGDVKELKELMAEFAALRQHVEIATCVVIDPDAEFMHEVDPILAKHVKWVPWDDDYSQRIARVAQMTNDIIAGVMQSIHNQSLTSASSHGTDGGWAAGFRARAGRDGKPAVDARSIGGAHRVLKHQGDVAVLTGDYKSAIGTYKEAADKAQHVGDALGRATALEGLACALANYKLFLCGGTVKGNAAADTQWREDVLVSFRQSLTAYGDRSIAPPCTTLFIEAGLRYTRFMIEAGEPRAIVAGVIAEVQQKCLALASPSTVYRQLGEYLVAVGYHRRAVWMLRQAAHRAAMAGAADQALRLYAAALRIMGVALEYDGGRFNAAGGRPAGPAASPTKGADAGAAASVTASQGRGGADVGADRLDVVQYQLIKEMMGVAKKMPAAPAFGGKAGGTASNGAGGYCDLYYQLALLAVFKYAHLGDKQWGYKTLLDLAGCGRDVPALGPTLPCAAVIRPLAPSLAPVTRHVPHGRGHSVFEHNPFLGRTGADAVVWVVGCTGEVEITLCNVLGLHLHVARVGVLLAATSTPSRVVATELATVAPGASASLVVGVQPLAPGRLRIEAVRVVLCEEGRTLPQLVLTLDPCLDVTVVRPLAKLSLAPKDAPRHAVAVPVLTGEVLSTTLVLRNTGAAAIAALALNAVCADPEGAAPRPDAAALPAAATDAAVGVRYDRAALEAALPLQPGGVVEVDVEVQAPLMMPEAAEHHMALVAVYGDPGDDEGEFVGTESFKNIEGRWDTYVLRQRRLALPLTVTVHPGLACAGVRLTPDRRYYEAEILNASRKIIHLVNHAFAVRHRTLPPVHRIEAGVVASAALPTCVEVAADASAPRADYVWESGASEGAAPLPEHVVKRVATPHFIAKVREGGKEKEKEKEKGKEKEQDERGDDVFLLPGTTVAVLLPVRQFVDERVEVVESDVDPASLPEPWSPTTAPPAPPSSDGSVTLRRAAGNRLVAATRRVRRGCAALGDAEAPYYGNVSLPWRCQLVRHFANGHSERRYTAGAVPLREGCAYEECVPKPLRPPHGKAYTVVEDTAAPPQRALPHAVAVMVSIVPEEDEAAAPQTAASGGDTPVPPLHVERHTIYTVTVALAGEKGCGDDGDDNAPSHDVTLGFALPGRAPPDLDPAFLGCTVTYEGPLHAVPLRRGGAAHTVAFAVHEPGLVHLQVQTAAGGARQVHTFSVLCSRPGSERHQ